ncbi:MAG TPA: M15 family metallopeptidase [Rhizomicrobium sp.]|nr:M15 family metallopeptidase [Rhizomicrobium sp.]
MRNAFCTAIAGIVLASGASFADEAPPPNPAPAMMRLIGQYGPDTGLLEIYESGGHLYADGDGFHQAELAPHGRDRFQAGGKTLVFGKGADASSVSLDGNALPRRDIGADVIKQIRAGEHGDPATLRAEALKATPPAEPPPKRSMDLVPLSSIDPTIKFDIRYATSNNFMGFPLYEKPGAYLQRPAAEALGRVAKALKAQGYGLLVHDGYRPWFVTKMFWDATPAADHMFVGDPAHGSRHNRGEAIDLTLYDLKTGKPVPMTGRYDEMSKRSYSDYIGGTSRQRYDRGVLRAAMEKEGFQVLNEEWWHFDYKDWADYPIGNVSFGQLER